MTFCLPRLSLKYCTLYSHMSSNYLPASHSSLKMAKNEKRKGDDGVQSGSTLSVEDLYDEVI